MSLRSYVRSSLLRALIAPRTRHLRRQLLEFRRRLARRPHCVSTFLELDDPYSYLLSRFLGELKATYAVDLEVYVVAAPIEGFRPRPDLLTDYAELDCRRLAHELRVPFLDRGPAPPVEYRQALVDAVVAADAMADVLPALEAYWRGDVERVRRRIGGPRPDAGALLAENRQRLEQLGHYNSATLHYAGEWYWGIDRLHYLTERLNELGVRRSVTGTGPGQRLKETMQSTLPAAPSGTARDLPDLELFFSFRSPYSYLVIPRAFAIADAFGLRLQLRPVLPMIMRGMPVPRLKLRYIVTDAAREAERLGMPFGTFCDPAGAGVARCIAVFCLADAADRGREFVRSATEAIWARGIDMASDTGMRAIAEEAGLDWSDVRNALRNESWQALVENNRESMMASGSWGVPTLRVGDFVVWGQDRDWLLVRHLEDLTTTRRQERE